MQLILFFFLVKDDRISFVVTRMRACQMTKNWNNSQEKGTKGDTFWHKHMVNGKSTILSAGKRKEKIKVTISSTFAVLIQIYPPFYSDQVWFFGLYNIYYWASTLWDFNLQIYFKYSFVKKSLLILQTPKSWYVNE